jgi:sporulation protein YlmC with PRC-barrel domain
MLKQLSLSALLALTSGLAVAQTPSPQSPTSETSASARSTATQPGTLSTNNWLASDIYRADVYDKSNNRIGSIDDLVIDQNGNVSAAVIGVGGFLGIGAKDVAVPFSELKITPESGRDKIVVDRSKDELRNAPAYDKNAQVNKM